MKINRIRLTRFWRLLIIVVTVFQVNATIQVQGASSPSDVTLSLYRGNAQRTGAYTLQGVPKPAAMAWKHNIGESGFSSPVYANETVYIGTNRGELLAVNGMTGEERWAFRSVGGNASSVAVADNVVYVGLGITESQGMGLYALDAETGHQLWAFKTNSPIWLSAPLIHEGAVYFGDQKGVFYSVDLTTHQERWRVKTNQTVLWYAAADQNGIYFAASNTMFAIDVQTGQQKWKKSIGTDWMPLAVADGVVYAGDRTHRFYALNTQTGKEVWTFKDITTDRGEWSAPAVANGVVYAGNRTEFMYAFDAQAGTQLWKFKAAAPATSDPIVSNGILYFGVASHGNESAGQATGYFYALDIKTGSELWKFETDGEIFNGPAISENRVYLVTASSDLYALQ